MFSLGQDGLISGCDVSAQGWSPHQGSPRCWKSRQSLELSRAGTVLGLHAAQTAAAAPQSPCLSLEGPRAPCSLDAACPETKAALHHRLAIPLPMSQGLHSTLQFINTVNLQWTPVACKGLFWVLRIVNRHRQNPCLHGGDG